jgi:hypothetical protein
MREPSALAAVLLALAAFRITRLVGWDDLTIPIRRWICGMGDPEHHALADMVNTLEQEGIDPWTRDGQDEASAYLARQLTAQHGEQFDGLRWRPDVGHARFYVSKLIHCPWCAGFWISLGVWAVWLWAPTVAVGLSVPLFFSAVIGLVAKNLDE